MKEFLRFLCVLMAIFALTVCSLKSRAIATSDFTVDMLERPEIVTENKSTNINTGGSAAAAESKPFVPPFEEVAIVGDLAVESEDNEKHYESVCEQNEPIVEEAPKQENVEDEFDDKPEETIPTPEPDPVQEPEENPIITEMENRGNIGRLRISSVGIDVAIFKSSIWDVNHAQKIVDNSDSAAIMYDSEEYYNFVIIADHVHQGFSQIKQAIPGVTIAVIDHGIHIETYVCSDKWIGYNGYEGTPGLHDLNGNLLYQVSGVDLCMYTCNSDGTITVTYWVAA